MERDFKGVWIPKEIWLNQDLGWSEKLLFVEIDSLAKNGQCFASNEYFGKFLGCHKKHISRLVSNLAETGLIRVELIYKPDSKQIDKRIIHVTTRSENVPTPPQECSYPHHENVPTPIRKKVEDSSFINNTLINNTINNTTNNTNKDKKINKKEISAELESQFESLWKLYPRKQGDKKKAKESYIKAVKTGETTYETVKNGIEMYIKYNEYHNVQEDYIKHGSTWFNQSCWDNDYTFKPKLIQGKRHGFLGLLLNEMDMQQSNVIDYEGTIINEQERDAETAFFTAKQLSQSL
jgi:hypothetical protein